MREKKFTEGSWEVETDDGMNPGITADGGKAVVWITGNIEEGIESIHDANLISAAPELLEALELMVARLEERSEYDKCGQLYYDARNAIAKAYGETL